MGGVDLLRVSTYLAIGVTQHSGVTTEGENPLGIFTFGCSIFANNVIIVFSVQFICKLFYGLVYVSNSLILISNCINVNTHFWQKALLYIRMLKQTSRPCSYTFASGFLF